MKDSTRVDLGDDLLQTKSVNRPLAEPGVEELLVNSKIQITEGFFDDAKVTLRLVLRMDPANITARERLEEIQNIEIRRLLGKEEIPRSSFLRSKNKKSKEEKHSAEEILHDLEKEVGASKPIESELFKTPVEMSLFLSGLEGLCVGATPQDRIDLGIGFLSMELFEVAIKQFEVAAKTSGYERKARGLLATTYVAQSKFYEALVELESLIADQSIPAEEKIDFGYLAGVSEEGLKNYESAVRWYHAVNQIDPEYRDVKERMNLAIRKCGKTQ